MDDTTMQKLAQAAVRAEDFSEMLTAMNAYVEAKEQEYVDYTLAWNPYCD